MEWKSIQINKQNIKAETSNAMLIAMPHNSKYNGYEFWHSIKLIREGKNSNAISVSYNDGFKFKLKKYGKGNYNKFDVIDEDEIDTNDFEQAFDIMNENITSSKKDTESYLIVNEPTKVDKDVEVREELKNDK